MPFLRQRPLLVLLLSCLLLVQLPLAPRAQAKDLDTIFRDTLEDLLGKQDKQRKKQQVPRSAEEIKLTFAPLVRDVAHSVVNVFTAKVVEVNRSPFSGDPFFERFFGRKFGESFGGPRRRERMQNSLGSGVIVSEDGIVLTNYHVIENADEVKVVLNDGADYDAEIILKDEKSDLAVLRIKDSKDTFDAIRIADSENVEVGDLVLAIGNPFGVGQTVTSGIVSAVARSRVGINDFDFFIQTDAAINPGNSGGALINMRGELIGINTAIYSRSGGSIGIGFAIPSNMARVVLRTVEQGADVVTRPWIGVTTQEVTSEIAESLGMRRPGGVLVSSVYPDGPADRAGLKSGDVIIGINRKVLMNDDELGYRLDTIGIGGEAELVVVSGRDRRVVSLRLEPAPETTPRRATKLDEEAVLGGATIANLSPAVAQEVGLPGSGKGVVVLGVEQYSRAAANGVQKGDMVREINGSEVESVDEVVKAVSRQSRRGWQVVLERGGRRIVFERNGQFFRQYLQ
ncbi:MAG: DegQ family serine endoprotease [Nitratireductor sp.]|nr:DegQ family serine endoprotease [Nitratireductor sp.]